MGRVTAPQPEINPDDQRELARLVTWYGREVIANAARKVPLVKRIFKRRDDIEEAPDTLRRTRVRAAKRIIGGNCDDKEVMNSVSRVMVTQGRIDARAHMWPQDATEAKAVGHIVRAMRLLQTALRSKDLPAFVPKPISQEAVVQFLEMWKPADSFSVSARRKSPVQRLAAQEAIRLLEHHNIAPTLTRGGQFVRLAATLYGQPEKDLFNICRAVKRTLPVENKVPGKV